MKVRLSDEDLRRASALVGARCGLRFDADNRALLEMGLERAAKAEGAHPTQLLDWLEQAPSDALVQSVLRQVTVGETYLFRHPDHFSALREVIVPERLGARAHERQLRAWSAGCATGEEAWSLLVALSGAAGAGWRVSVLGTDINKRALETAAQGRYSRWSVRGDLPTSNGMLRALPDGGVEVAPWLRGQLRFDYLNLNDAVYPSLFTATQGLDVIFCRNVLVYFMPDKVAQVLARLADCLVEGGWLVVGALDVDRAPAALERVRLPSGVMLLRRRAEAERPRERTTTPTSLARVRVSTPSRPIEVAPARTATMRRLIEDARAAADRGALDEAVQLSRRAVAEERSPAALHLLALVLGEQGEEDERLTLLREVSTRSPDDALAHLALGTSERAGPPAERAAHLRRVLALTARRLDNERLYGPESLPVSWVRKVAAAALRRLEEGTV